MRTFLYILSICFIALSSCQRVSDQEYERLMLIEESLDNSLSFAKVKVDSLVSANRRNYLDLEEGRREPIKNDFEKLAKADTAIKQFIKYIERYLIVELQRVEGDDIKDKNLQKGTTPQHFEKIKEEHKKLLIIFAQADITLPPLSKQLQEGSFVLAEKILLENLLLDVLYAYQEKLVVLERKIDELTVKFDKPQLLYSSENNLLYEGDILKGSLFMAMTLDMEKYGYIPSYKGKKLKIKDGMGYLEIPANQLGKQTWEVIVPIPFSEDSLSVAGEYEVIAKP